MPHGTQFFVNRSPDAGPGRQNNIDKPEGDLYETSV